MFVLQFVDLTAKRGSGDKATVAGILSARNKFLLSVSQSV